MIIIGEAANKLSPETKSKAANIDWVGIVGFRNVAVHQYYEVDYEIIWSIIKGKLPALESFVKKTIQQQV